MKENDFIGGWKEMRRALVEHGYPPSDLRQALFRGNPPPSWKTGIFRLYRWSEVEKWAQAKKRQHKIDLGNTTLGRWLEPRETTWRFSCRLGVRLAYVHRLLGHRSSLWRDKLPPIDAILKISRETGISVATLITDAPEEPF